LSLYITGTKDFSLSKELENKLNKAFLLICNEEEISNSSVNLKILSNTDIQELNKKYRKINNPTNVLSFTNEDISKSITGDLGDIAISYEYLQKESYQQNKKFDDHFIHMLIHAVYHILGFDHKNDEMAKLMEIKEIKILKKLNINNPY
jgi:probable rRNA maturation factor|tara:strand:- start:2839 stop:3285 length:447 start_codon:yes stop_codon:yes gene_type:complete